MAFGLHFFALEIRPDGVVRHPFVCAVDAEEGARVIARLTGAAVAYQQWGDPESEVWDDPDVLLRIGRVPRRLLEPQAA